MNEPNHQTDTLIGQLRQLQPARSKLDVRQAFYQAGFEACRAQTRTRDLRHLAVGIAATLLAAIILVPASYHLGKTGAMSRDSLGVAKTDSNDAIHQSITPAPLRPSAVPTLEATAEPEPIGVVELAAVPEPSNRLLSWINPLAGIAKSTKLDRQSESMVTTSHASLFALESSIRNLSEFPFSLPSPNKLKASVETESADTYLEESRPTLAVGDFQAIAITLEASR